MNFRKSWSSLCIQDSTGHTRGSHCNKDLGVLSPTNNIDIFLQIHKLVPEVQELLASSSHCHFRWVTGQLTCVWQVLGLWAQISRSQKWLPKLKASNLGTTMILNYFSYIRVLPGLKSSTKLYSLEWRHPTPTYLPTLYQLKEIYFLWRSRERRVNLSLSYDTLRSPGCISDYGRTATNAWRTCWQRQHC